MEYEISEERRRELEDAFEMFDKDKDGSITAKELKNVMDTLGQNPSDEEVTAMLREADTDQRR